MKKREEIFDPRNNYKNYYTFLRQWESENKKQNAQSCIIPYFGRYLAHFQAVSENNASHLADGHLNPDRLSLLADQHASLQKYQSQLLTYGSELLNETYIYDIATRLQQKAEIFKMEFINMEVTFDELYQSSKQVESAN